MPTTVDNYAFTNTNEMGPVSEPPPDCVPLDVWRKVLDLDTKEPTGMVKRERMRTLQEVFRDLRDRLDVLLCDHCGHERDRRPSTTEGDDYGGDECTRCGAGEYQSLIDEYFSGPDTGNQPVPHDYRWVACYPVTGGSEGHYIHIEFLVPAELVTVGKPGTDFETIDVDVSRKGLWRVVQLALGKTFKGMDHAAEIARRCAKLLGA